MLKDLLIDQQKEKKMDMRNHELVERISALWMYLSSPCWNLVDQIIYTHDDEPVDNMGSIPVVHMTDGSIIVFPNQGECYQFLRGLRWALAHKELERKQTIKDDAEREAQEAKAYISKGE